MYSVLIAAAAASFSAAIVLTPICRDVAIRWGFVDQPDNNRKLHAYAIPRIGGVSVFIAYLAAIIILSHLAPRISDIIRDHLEIAWKILIAGCVIFVTGLLDDLVSLRPFHKLAGQLAAAVIAFIGGVRLTNVAGHDLGWLAFPVTILWLVGCTNAFNLIDGVDGLAAGVGLFATVTTLMAALLNENIPLALATAPLAGALLGFLRYNFNGATVFLGDSGSLLIGFLLGCFSVFWSGKSATILGMTAPLMALVIPLLDTLLAIVRRYLRRQPIFGADRGHIHHRLLARGLTPRRVVVLIYAICGVAGCLSLLQSVFQDKFGGAIMILFCVGTWLGIQRLGYAEFDAARRIVLGGAFRHLLNAELQLISFRDALAVASTSDEYWDVLRQTYTEFGFDGIKLRLGNRTYAHGMNGNRIFNSWTMQIPVSETEYVTLSRDFDRQASLTIAPFADTIGSILRANSIRTQQHSIPASDKEYAPSHSTLDPFAAETREVVKQVAG